MDCKPTRAPGPFDIAALREIYRQERDKRRHPQGQDQYTEVSDGYDDFYEVDPLHPIVPRDPVSAEIDVAVLGAGFAGLIASARLKAAGVADIRTIDMAGDFGGTWYWNRYPGLQCDTDACSYMPMLEEVPYVPKDLCGRLPHCKCKIDALALVGCRLLSGLFVQSAVTAGPDGVREPVPILQFRL